MSEKAVGVVLIIIAFIVAKFVPTSSGDWPIALAVGMFLVGLYMVIYGGKRQHKE